MSLSRSTFQQCHKCDNATGRALGGLVNNTNRPPWFALLCFRTFKRAIMMFRNFKQLNTSSFCRVDRVSVSCRPDVHRRPLETPAVHLGKCPLSLREIQIASSVVRVFDESRHRFDQDTAAVITSFELSTMMKSSSPDRVSKQNVRPSFVPPHIRMSSIMLHELRLLPVNFSRIGAPSSRGRTDELAFASNFPALWRRR
ncbi:hypothetical protein BN1723_001485 [Verticillium longisporum]|uniref:Uncharacterized protein n=1 Tax=Verticillium longisporum TaxID=100787 RepID=A0A0G4KEU0_VERLO|nr:hypothetical protein BN1723_001485 [Verticillium longisporum]